MKFCSTCQEEFADKFGFCPVDGTPLTVVVPKQDVIREESVTRPAAQAPRVPAPAVHAPAIMSSEPAYAGIAAGAATAAALSTKGEYHLTFLDDVGLTQRLIAELRKLRTI